MTLTEPIKTESFLNSGYILPEAGSRASLVKDFATNFLIVLSVYFVVHVFVTRANLLGASPIYSDDYDGFGSTFQHLRTSWFRPLSTLLWSVLCAFGPSTFFTVAQIWFIAFIASVFTYAKRFFNLTVVPLVLTICASSIAVSFEYLTQYYFFSGAILGVMSGSFAVASILFYFGLTEDREKAPFPFVSSLCSIASMLCKEDFILPLLLFYCFVVSSKKDKCREAAIINLGVILATLCITFFLQKVVLPSQFFSGQSVHYIMDFSLSSLVSMYWKYLTCTAGAKIAFGLQLLFSTIALFTATVDRKKVVLFSLQSLSLIGPFSLLVNHFCEFYAFSWICFQSAAVLLVANIFVQVGAKSKTAYVLLSMFTVVIAGGVIYLTMPQRDALLSWYQHAADVSRRIDETLIANRPVIADASEVTVLDPPLLSPWMRADGSYLKNKLGLNSQWTVYAQKNSELGKMAAQFCDVKHDGVTWHLYESTIPSVSSTVIKFNEDGTSKFVVHEKKGLK